VKRDIFHHNNYKKSSLTKRVSFYCREKEIIRDKKTLLKASLDKFLMLSLIIFFSGGAYG